MRAQKEQPSILGSRSPSPTPHSKSPKAFRVRDQRIKAVERFYSAKMFDLSKDPYVLAQQSIWLSR
nr:hypothetical protein [Mycobacterium pseudoshottsii]